MRKNSTQLLSPLRGARDRIRCAAEDGGQLSGANENAKRIVDSTG